MATAALVPVLLSGGVAYAYWSASGSGSAAVSTSSAAPLKVTAGATAPPGLYPGRTVDLGVTVANSNPYPVRLDELTAVTVTSSDEAACAASSITLPTAVVDGMAAGGYVLPNPLDVAAGSNTQGTLAGLITLSSSAVDTCQGKTFTVSLSFTGAQVA